MAIEYIMMPEMLIRSTWGEILPGAQLARDQLLAWPRGCLEQEGDCDKENQVITDTKGNVGGEVFHEM